MSLNDVEEELSYSQWKRVELPDGKKTTLVVEKKLKEFVTVARIERTCSQCKNTIRKNEHA